MLVCLEKCTDNLDTANREIILGYYTGEKRVKIENRPAITARLEISVNALNIRPCRIRNKLETCVKKCAEKKSIIDEMFLDFCLICLEIFQSRTKNDE